MGIGTSGTDDDKAITLDYDGILKLIGFLQNHING
jgi:hypothetical protein